MGFFYLDNFSIAYTYTSFVSYVLSQKRNLGYTISINTDKKNPIKTWYFSLGYMFIWRKPFNSQSSFFMLLIAIFPNAPIEVIYQVFWYIYYLIRECQSFLDCEFSCQNRLFFFLVFIYFSDCRTDECRLSWWSTCVVPLPWCVVQL